MFDGKNDFVHFGNNGRLGSSADIDDNDPAWIESGSLVSVENIKNEIPNDYQLLQNYPNSFNNETVIKLALPKVSKVLAVFFIRMVS